MSRHNLFIYFYFYFFSNSVKSWSVLCCNREKLSRPKNVMFTCTYVATDSLFSILESKANLVVTDRTKKNIVMTDFIQFKSHDVATKKHNVATQFVLLQLKVAT